MWLSGSDIGILSSGHHPITVTSRSLAIVINTLRPRQNGRHFADNIFKCIFLNENVWIPVMISLKFVPKGTINNIPELVQIMAWRRSGNKPLFETMMVILPTYICVTRPQWVKRHCIVSGIFQLNVANIILANALAPCITRSSAGTILLTDINSFWPSGAIRQERIGWRLKSCCLAFAAPNHYLNQCWIIISKVHLGAISQEIPSPPITKFIYKITHITFHKNTQV